MNTPMTDVLADDMQHARGVLAELCERGDELLSREQHLNVLEAFDSLERANRGSWTPPPAAQGITDVRAALSGTKDALDRIIAGSSYNDFDTLPMAMSAYNVEIALRVS